jgi:DNA-binding MarR family transcriptional regulator
METGTSLFLKMWSAWRSKLPNRLANQDPDKLIRLLELGSKNSGVSQSVAAQELGFSQSHLSKLMKKLLQEGWIKVEKSKTDGRLTPMKTTQRAEEWLSSLQERLTGLHESSGPGATRRRRKESAPKPQLYSLLPEPPDKDASEPPRAARHLDYNRL